MRCRSQILSASGVTRIVFLSFAVFVSGCDNYEVTVYDPDKAWDGYTVPSRMLADTTHVIDMEGNIVKEFDCVGYPARVLPDSSIICNELKIGSLTVPSLRQVSWDGQELWYFDDWDNGNARQHHDFQLDGNPVGYYVPGMEMNTPANGSNMLVSGYEIYSYKEQNVRLGSLEDSILYEIDALGNVIWEWHSIDHLDEMGLSESAIKDMYIEFLDDVLHINSASYIGPNKWYDAGDQRFHPQNIIVGSPKARFVAIIDKVSGQIVWRMGPDFSEGEPGADYGGFAFQHHPHIVPRGLPGEGNLLMFDNGTFSGFGDQATIGRTYSRVLEINPIDYSLVWEYRKNLWSLNMGSVQRLPNGNTLITEGLPGNIIEVTQEEEVVWQSHGAPLYRAYRIPKEWIRFE